MFNIWLFTTMKICPKGLKIAKLCLEFWPRLNKWPKFTKVVKYCQIRSRCWFDATNYA